ncbi:DUF2480 family protein [bacterium]|nr:DUF2480 family protein [bacterium]
MSLIKFPLDEIVGNGIVRESEFRTKLNTFDLEPYRDAAVLIPWLHKQEVPLWVYMMTVAKLTPIAAVLSFGEPCSPVTLSQRTRINHANPSK